MFKLPIPTRLTDYLGEAVVWTVISIEKRIWALLSRALNAILKCLGGP